MGHGRTDMKAAVGYARRSTDRQEQSIGDQKRAVETWAEAEGLQLLDWYVDDAISGAAADGREAFLKMVEDAKQPGCPFRYILVYDVKRFGRLDNDETGYYRHLLTKAGVEVVYVSENFSGDDTDDLLRPVKQWQARQELKDLSKVTIRGLVTKTDGGWWMGGVPPHGYDLAYYTSSGKFLMIVRHLPGGGKHILNEHGDIERTLEPSDRLMVSKEDRGRLTLSSPERVRTVQHIFAWYVEDGLGFKGIAQRLNQERVPAPGRCSDTWSMSTIREIVINPTYMGDMVWNRRTMAKFYSIAQKRAVVRPKVGRVAVEDNDEADWIVTRDSHPAIVTRRLFEMARTLRLERRKRYPHSYRRGRGATSDYLLTGLLICSRCGHRWQGTCQIKSKRRVDGTQVRTKYYACGGYISKGNAVCRRSVIPKDVIEQFLFERIGQNLRRFLDGKQGRAMLAEAIRDVYGGFDADHVERERRQLLARRTEVEHKIERLIENATPTTLEFVDKRVAELKIELDQGTARLAELDAEADKELEVEATATKVLDYMERFDTVAATGTVDEKRRFLRAFTRCVEIDPDSGRGRAELYSLPMITASPAEANDAEKTSLIMVAGAGFEPAASGL
jgi:site-specific DNA recombinase